MVRLLSQAPKPDFPTRGEVETLAERYRLVLPRELRSPRAGEVAGRRAGSSVEYQDRKDFAPGDDLRHVDWRGFARSDRMTVKLYREEIMPRVDIVVDGSASMEVTPQKALRRTELATFFWLMARHIHGQAGVWLAAGSRPEPLGDPVELLSRRSARLENPLGPLRGSPVSRPGGIRVFISDLLFPFSPPELDAAFGACDQLFVVQVLSDFEADPGAGLQRGAMIRLQNAEADEHLDVRLTPQTVEQYGRRLAALQTDVAQRLRMRGGALATVTEHLPLEQVCRLLHGAGMITL
jgi:uncharacterized protein (DUF58 family)